MKHCVVRMEDISFPSKVDIHLEHIRVDIYAGEVTGIMGLNASEREAFTAVLSGWKQAEKGVFSIEGERFNAAHAEKKLRRIAAYMGPEEVLTSYLSIADNLFVLGQREKGKGWRRWFVDEEENRRKAAEYLAIAQIQAHPDALVNTLSAEEKQRLEFVRAVLRGVKLIVCNSPLNRSELVANERAFKELLQYARTRGIAVVMMFSNIDRMIRFCDHVVVVRGGMTVYRCDRDRFDRVELSRIVAGETLAMQECEPAVACGRAVLEIRNVSADRFLLRHFSMRVRSGEIVGVVCANEEWNERFMSFLQGEYPVLQGSILRNAKVIEPGLLRRTCTKENKACFVIGNKDFGLHENLSIMDNLLLLVGERLARLPLHFLGDDAYDFACNLCLSEKIITQKEQIVQPISILTQEQKLRLTGERLKLFRPDLCVMMGVEETDFALQAGFAQLCRELTRQGSGVLLLATQMQGIADICGQILLVRNGRVLRRLDRSQFGQTDTAELYRELE